MKDFNEIDGRSIRQQNIFNQSHDNLVKSAIDLLKNPDIDNDKINVSLIAKKAGTSVATAYNHFPQNMVDVYGSIFALAFRNASEELALYIKTEKNIEKQIEAFINTQSKQIVELGEAIRVAFFNINEIVSSGNWTQNEPFDFLLDLCKKFNETKDIDFVVNNYKPTIFWKDKEITKEQIKKWEPEKIREMIFKLNDIELQIKKNMGNSLNLISNFILDQSASKTNSLI